MKKFLSALTLLVLFFTLSISKVNANIGNLDQELSVKCDLDNNNDVNFIHKVRLIGNSDDTLSSGVTIDLPFEAIKINSVKFQTYAPRYEIKNNKIYINLESFPLKANQSEEIIINYSVSNLINQIQEFKFLSIPSPTNSQKDYNLSIDCTSEEFKTIFSNIPLESKKTKSGLEFVFKKSSPEMSNLNIQYLENETGQLPIISNNYFGFIKVLEIENSRIGKLDNNKNFFLNKIDDSNQLKVNLQIANKTSLIDSQFPFKDLPINQIDSTEFEIITQRVKDKFDPNTQNIVNLNLEQLENNIVASSLEYSIYLSSQLSKNSISNRVVYGLVQHPKLEKATLGFWVEVKKNDNTITLDPYFAEVVGINPATELPRIPFGLISEINLDSLPHIIKLQNIQVIKYEPIDVIEENDNKSLGMNFSLKNNGVFTFDITNNSDYFGYVENSSNQFIYNQIKYDLFVPKTSIEKKLQLENKVDKLNITVDSNLNSIVETTSFSITSERYSINILFTFCAIFSTLILLSILKYFVDKINRKYEVKKIIRERIFSIKKLISRRQIIHVE